VEEKEKYFSFISEIGTSQVLLQTDVRKQTSQLREL